MKRSLVVLTVVLLAVGLLFGGCIPTHSKLAAGNTLRLPMQTNPAFIDPARSQDDYSQMIVLQVFEGLVQRGEDGHVIPCLAEKWELTDGGKSYVFHLRDGVKFSNGDPVTADDVKYSIERAANPAIKSSIAETYLGDIVGLVDKVHDRAKEVSGVTVIDPKTVKITIDKPRPYFLGKLCFPISAVVNKRFAKMDQVMTAPEELVGTGPFVLKRYVEDQVVVLDANEKYWGGRPKIDHIEQPILKDAVTRLNQFKAGDLDAIQLQTRDVAALKSDPTLGSEVQVYSRAGVDYVAMNSEVYPPFAKRGVRRAFAMAIDRKKLVESLLSGVHEVATGILPKEVLGYRPQTAIPPFDPAAAKKELADAGFPGGQGLPALDLYFRSNDEDQKIVAQAIQEDLKTNLGVEVSVKPVEWGTFLDRINHRQVAFYTLGWLADYVDPQNFLSTLLTTTGAENRSHYSNPEVDRLCAEADVLPEKDPKRLADYAKAEDLILDDAGWIALYFNREPWLVSTRAKGIRHAFFGWLPHTQVDLGPVKP